MLPDCFGGSTHPHSNGEMSLEFSRHCALSNSILHPCLNCWTRQCFDTSYTEAHPENMTILRSTPPRFNTRRLLHSSSCPVNTRRVSHWCEFLSREPGASNESYGDCLSGLAVTLMGRRVRTSTQQEGRQMLATWAFICICSLSLSLPFCLFVSYHSNRRLICYNHLPTAFT